MRSYTIALAGNPNTGKSTLFNALTGMHQHTGNWAGKTVTSAEGYFEFQQTPFKIVDLPGTYSLYSNSADEEAARDYIIFENPDVTIVVLDATSLERNLNLALQVLEMTNRAVVCINLMDEAKRLGIKIDLNKMQQKLGVPTVAISARSKKGIGELLQQVLLVASGELVPEPITITYSEDIEQKIKQLEPQVRDMFGSHLPARWIALRLLDNDESLLTSIKNWLQRGQTTAQLEGVIRYGETACH
ncbi:FeoB small GTPase domain-containing protein [Paenibacillus sp. 1001270B_150601_E10]|uniref:FeoB small GTPase domain-containing protein n=1 Tax=Paenibacillus sp. 1001270B_150601_E10 TaxID=2787079 RepID=UPI00189D15F2|nr:FeoB small GTPase domain-containing protein [Paenibacillus sp. 1001270B_150601_E10]